MAVEDYIEVYRILIVIAFLISAINLIGYTILAPWYKYALGRIVWLKFLANTLVLLVPFTLVTGSDLPFRRELSIVAMSVFIVAITTVGIGIYVTQIKGYIRKTGEKKPVKVKAGK